MDSCIQCERPSFDLAVVVRNHRDELERSTPLTCAQRRVLNCIERCRTADLGGHVEVCHFCGYCRPVYNSCCNRHCPKCQFAAQERWIRARSGRLLDVKHFHVVFTLPSELRALARYRPKIVFAALLASARDALLELGSSRLHATLGITTVLHTWTRDLRFHPHVHALVTAGGLSENEARWVHSSAKYLFPVAVMGKLLRGKMLHALRLIHREKELEGFEEFQDPQAFDRLMARIAAKAWVVYAKEPFRRAAHVLEYLGRYTHRVAIANSRLVDVSDDRVTFRTKGSATATLPPCEFLSRFIQHVLPDGFKKIRHAGLYAAANVRRKLVRAATLCASPTGESEPGEHDHGRWELTLLSFTGRDITRCPNCGGELIAIIHPFIAPPRRDSS